MFAQPHLSQIPFKLFKQISRPWKKSNLTSNESNLNNIYAKNLSIPIEGNENRQKHCWSVTTSL